jgi:hypothetical protein
MGAAGGGEEKLAGLLQESLATAVRGSAAKPADFTKVIVDTTVQPKAVSFPTDARLMHCARERLVRLTKKHGIALRQSYVRIGKFALIKRQRYAHAKQFKRAKRPLRTLKTQLGRVIRDIGRKIKGRTPLEEAFAKELMLARRFTLRTKICAGSKERMAPISASSVCMHRRSSASGKERPASLMSSASRSRLQRRSIVRKAASSLSTPRPCLGSHMTDTPSAW